MATKRHALRTTMDEIADYWAPRVDDDELNFFWSEAHERCWRCGTKKSLQRCHIVAHSLHGADDPSNLVILCSECHAESPDVDDPEIMWDWLRAYRAVSPVTFWVEQGFREYEFMYKRSVQEELDFLQKHGVELHPENLMLDVSENAGGATRHFGISHASPATFAGLLRHYLKTKAKSAGVELPEGRW